MTWVNYQVYSRFMERWTDEDRARLKQIERDNVLERCPLVEQLREEPRDAKWFDVAAYIGELGRFSATFVRSPGNQVVCGGGEVRPDGVMKRWEYVAGEFEAR